MFFFCLREISEYHLKLKAFTYATVRKANKFKSSPHLKAVKLWASFYLIQLHSFVTHPLFSTEILSLFSQHVQKAQPSADPSSFFL